MPSGVLRILPFALISTALHAVVLVGTTERLEFAVTPDGRSGAVAVRLVPAGPPAPRPAERAGSDAAPIAEDRVARANEAATGSTAPASKAAAAESAAEPAPDVGDEAAPRPDSEREPGPERDRAPETKAASEPASGAASRGPAAKATADTPQRRQTADAASGDAGAPSSSPASGAGGEARRAQLARRAREEVTVRLREHFHYPRIARRRGWEGRVVLGLRVHADGRIGEIAIVESSGRAILDESARESLRRIERIPALADDALGEPLELRLPVTYRLQPA